MRWQATSRQSSASEEVGRSHFRGRAEGGQWGRRTRGGAHVSRRRLTQRRGQRRDHRRLSGRQVFGGQPRAAARGGADRLGDDDSGEAAACEARGQSERAK